MYLKNKSMDFNEFKNTLHYKKYNNSKILLRFLEYKLKILIIDIITRFNLIKLKSKPYIDLGSFKDNRFINFIIFALKDDFIFLYKYDDNSKKLLRRIGILNFFKYTAPNNKRTKQKKIKLFINRKNLSKNEISLNTNYFEHFYNENKNMSKKFFMPYYMYPRIYNSFYNKIYINKKPNFNFRIFFSGSIFKDVYNNFYWSQEPVKFPNRIEVINNIIKEFGEEIFFINSKKDLKSNEIYRKKIIFCLHKNMVKKTSYTLNFNENFKLLRDSCFHLSCPGAVMPLCHHLIEGIKVGSIPITNCEKLIFPNLNSNMSLQYSSINELILQVKKALEMKEEEIMFRREKVLDYYDKYLSPKSFRLKFIESLKNGNNEIICNDDHRSVEKMNLN